MALHHQWSCPVCQSNNTYAPQEDEDHPDDVSPSAFLAQPPQVCELCNTPRPRTLPLELVATIPLAAVLLFIAVALPMLFPSNQRSLEHYIKIDMASLITFAHTALLGAFGTVAWLSRNPLFGASVQVCLALGTVVSVGTLLSLSFATCWSKTFLVPLFLICLFGCTSLFGALVVHCSHRYPTFQCYNAKDTKLDTLLRRILCVEFLTVVVFVVVRSRLFPVECGQDTTNSKQMMLLGFIESFHMSFHEAFLLGCGWAALWSKGFYIDLLLLSSGIYGMFYGVHVLALLLSGVSNNSGGGRRSSTDTLDLNTNVVYLLMRTLIKAMACWTSYKMKKQSQAASVGTSAATSVVGPEISLTEQKDHSLPPPPASTTAPVSQWIRYLPPPTIFYIWYNSKITSTRTRIGSFVISIAGLCTMLSFHYESIVLALWGNTQYHYENIFTSLNFGIHGMMVIPYLCGLCMSAQAYDQFRLLHVLLNAVAGIGSFVLAGYAATTLEQVQRQGQQMYLNNPTQHLVGSLVLRGVASWAMGVGFLLLSPLQLATALEQGTVENNVKNNHFVQLNAMSVGESEGESEEESEEKLDKHFKHMGREQKQRETTQPNIEDTVPSSSQVKTIDLLDCTDETPSHGHSVETICTTQEMHVIERYQRYIEKFIMAFVLLTAIFTATTIVLNALRATGEQKGDGNHTEASTTTGMQDEGEQQQQHWVAPEPLGYGFIFHISFLLPMFTLHGLWTGMVMTLRVGICFSLSVAMVMPSIGAMWYDGGDDTGSGGGGGGSTVVSVGAWLCCVSAVVLFCGGGLFYYHLTSIVKSKSVFVSDSSSSFFKVFGRTRKR